MTEQEINIAIAEACGWQYMPGEEPRYGGTFKAAHWLSPGGERKITDWREKTDSNLPSYCTDLNAMHEAEKSLNLGQIRFYQDWLIRIVVNPKLMTQGIDGWLIHATARQRAEAFLRTLGKWRE